MTRLSEYFNPETLFSQDNPFLKSAEKTHRLYFETLDKAARLQLAFAEDVLDINRERFDSLYERQAITDLFAAQQNLVAELGKRTIQHARDLREALGEVQASVTEAANELGDTAKPRKGAAKSKKAA